MSRPILHCFSLEALLCSLSVPKETGRVTWLWCTVESKILLQGHSGPAGWFLDGALLTCTTGFPHPAGPCGGCYPQETRAHSEVKDRHDLRPSGAHSRQHPLSAGKNRVHLSVGASGRMRVYTLYSPVGNTYHRNPKHTPPS